MLHNFSNETVVAALSVANTPGFLIQRLKFDPMVRALAERATFEELVQEIRRILGKSESTFSDGAEAYAYLFAMCIQDSAEVLNLFHAGELSRLSWAEQIIANNLTNKEKTNFVSFPAPATLISSPHSSFLHTNTHKIDISSLASTGEYQ
ncbi:hypothetical protein [Burkholderia gladioli]|uniref:hypothetical protein n=1 Tax=Burkholderia gladioli TaxID=28095 RepID=UPI00163E006B|nr:hypothetical protein [Burkholderia gladioli]